MRGEGKQYYVLLVPVTVRDQSVKREKTNNPVAHSCNTVTFTVLASYNTAPHNRYQPHPAEPEQYTVCSNMVFVLLKMGIVMPKTC
jgi:hypothetical protein